MAHDSESKVQEKMKEQPKNPEEVEKKKNTTEEVKKKNKQCKNPEEKTTVEVKKKNKQCKNPEEKTTVEVEKERMEKKKQPDNAVEAEKTKNTTEEGKKKKKKQPNNPEVEKNENSTEGVKKMKRKRQPDDPEEIGNEKDTTEEVKNKEKEKKRKKQPNYSEVEESKSTTVEVKKDDKKNSSDGVEKNKNTTEEEKKKKKKKQPKNPVEIPEQQQQQQEDRTKITDNNCESRSQVKTEQKQNVSHNKRKIKEVFPHGNYRSYYGYRIGQGSEEDPRLKAFQREWFEGKDCLDIGCNSGIVTIQIAKKFCCRTMLGIDIDPERISDARWNLKKVMRAERTGNPSTKAARLEATEEVNGSEHSTALSLEREKNARDGSPSKGRYLFDIVSFRQENFVESQRPTGKHYDTILCLSVTKWVHLNCGDDGLITLFSKIWELLHPGGILVLEPQPWKSYEKNRRVTETTAKNFPTITLYPESFQEILLDKIGFRGVEDITSGLSVTKTGFDRPIFAFRK